MKLRDWAQRCSAGDICVVNGVTVECVPDGPDNPRGSCESCVFNGIEPDMPPPYLVDGWNWDCCATWWCHRASPEAPAGVYFRATEGDATALNPLAEVELYTLYPHMPKPACVQPGADSAKHSNECADSANADDPEADKAAAILCAEFAAKLDIVRAVLDRMAMYSLVCAGMPGSELEKAEKDFYGAKMKIADLIRRVEAFRFKDERTTRNETEGMG